MKKLAADPIIEPNAAGDFLYIGPDFFTKVSDFIDECDLGGEECVCRIFDQFSGATRREKKGRLIEAERSINFALAPFWRGHHLFR